MPSSSRQNMPSKNADLFTRHLIRSVTKGVIPTLVASMLSRQNSTSIEDDFPLAYRAGMVLVYRLLVLLAAEARRLLPVDEDGYASLSLRGLLNAPVRHDAAAYLEKLTQVVHLGDDSLNIAPYPGRLFDTSLSEDDHAPLAAEIRFLHDHPLSNESLRQALKHLCDTSTITLDDFGALNAQHLGRLHEHLMAHHLQPAADNFYLEESRQGRRVTSSFYTPAHIVSHIVDSTLRPLLDRQFECLQSRLASDECTPEAALNILLDVRVLDPAMGSGYFLVEALRYISDDVARRLTLTGFTAPEKILLRRMIARRCLFGVDLDPLAAELAALSLGLETAIPGMPLLGVDHHLRYGDALVGTLELTRTIGPGSPHWELMCAAGGGIEYVILKSLDATPGEARTTRAALKRIETKTTPLRAMLDGQIIPRDGSRPSDGRYLHWVLAFPHVFTDCGRGRWKTNGGFDAVIGNPPYDVVVNTDGPTAQAFIRWVKTITRYQPALGGRLNLFRLMMALGHALLAEGGILGQIVPLGLLTDRSSDALRSMLIAENQPLRIDCFPQKDDPRRRVFPEAKLSTCIYIGQRGSSGAPFDLYIYPGGDFANPEVLHLSAADVASFDPHGYTIPLLSNAAFQTLLDLHTQHEPFSSIARTRQGEINLTLHRSHLTGISGHGRLIRGAEVARYRLQPPSQGQQLWVDTQRFRLPLSRREDLERWRIVTQHITGIDDARRLNAMLIEPGVFCANSVNYTVMKPPYSPYYGLALLNAYLLDWRFRVTSTNNNANAYEIDALPVPPIQFVTAPERRNQLVEKARRLYLRCLSEGHACVLEFSAHHLARGEGDVIHDLLAFLAREMIDLYQQHTTETGRFLHTLETEIEGRIDDLSGKRLLQAYAEAGMSFESFYKRLTSSKNRRHLRAEMDDPARIARIRKAYAKSLEQLQPLGEKISTTERLIDMIVYQLYGLASEEIALIEGKS